MRIWHFYKIKLYMEKKCKLSEIMKIFPFTH